MECTYKRLEYDDGEVIVIEEPKNVFSKDCPNECCLTCKHCEKLWTYKPEFKDTHIGCWHVSDECGDGDHRWCIDTGNTFKCTDWIDKNAKVIPEFGFGDVWVCRCDWDGYFDFRIICMQGAGHVRVSFYPDEVIISDLFVSEEQRNKGYGTSLLNYVDELVEKFGEGKEASISALTDWEKEWYTRRGYKVIVF